MPPQAATERPSAKILKPSTKMYDGIFVPLMFCFAIGAPPAWTLSKAGKTVTPDVAPRVVTDDPLVHRQLVLDGAGIAILPLYIALDPAIAKRLAPILPGWQPKPVVPCALYSDSAHLTPKVKVFLDFIQKYLGTR